MIIVDYVGYVIEHYPEKEWINKIKEKYPDEDIDYIVSTIQSLVGDIKAV